MSVVADKPKSRSRQTPFPRDKFETIPAVVVFAEHQTRLRDGTPVTYDRQVLKKIAANCNRRIEETGNYAAVCIGHTDRYEGDKPLIGFAGPFRVEERDRRAVWLLNSLPQAQLHLSIQLFATRLATFCPRFLSAT